MTTKVTVTVENAGRKAEIKVDGEETVRVNFGETVEFTLVDSNKVRIEDKVA